MPKSSCWLFCDFRTFHSWNVKTTKENPRALGWDDTSLL